VVGGRINWWNPNT